MNGLTLSELCCLLCCPPCPGRIAAKLAFLPPEPTYWFTEAPPPASAAPAPAPGDSSAAGQQPPPNAATAPATGITLTN